MLLIIEDLICENIIQQLNMINESQGSSSPESQPEKLIPLQKKAIEQKQPGQHLINGGGVLNGIQFLLIATLIYVSMSSVWTKGESLHKHQRFLRMYFNLNLLGLNSNGFYENDDNIDQSFTQFDSYKEMIQLMEQLLNVSKSYQEDGVTAFNLNHDEPIITIEPSFNNGSLDFYQFYDTESAMTFFDNFETDKPKSFLLSLKSVTITSRLGDSKFANNYKIIADLSIHHNLMMEADLNYEYDQMKQNIAAGIEGRRLIERILSAVLLFLFIKRMVELKTEEKFDLMLEGHNQTIRKIYRNWYLFLCLLNIIAQLSWQLVPMCAWLQLLPIFEFPKHHHKEESNYLNFNKNIRYSLPLIVRIWIPLLLCLNGFIYFAMLMYANSDDGYFSDYFYAFFDFMYQMFQCGIYEIFTQMQLYGYLAEILQGFLYFYVFMVGTTLIPALFVSLIQLKLNQRDIAIFTQNLVKQAACPNCQCKNSHLIDQKALNITVTSPKLSPLMKQNTLLHYPKTNQKGNSDSKRIKNSEEEQHIKLFIEEQQIRVTQSINTYKFKERFISYSRKIQRLLRQLEYSTSHQIDKNRLEATWNSIMKYQLPLGKKQS